ncbi:MAG: hypothetical protein ACRD3E_20075 [Terriglobales bacterium]
MRHPAYIPAAFAVVLALIGNARAQASPGDVTQLKSSLAAAQDEIKRNHAEIDDLRQRLQRLEERLGGPSDKGPTYPTAAIVQQEPQGVPAQPQNEDTQLLSEKINDMDQVKVESASHYKVRLSGLVLMNTYSDWGNLDVSDLPNLVFRRQPGQAGGNFGATLRQSQVALDVTGPRLAGATTSANLNMDFFGGFPDTQYGVTAGLIRLRTASARLDWQNTSLVFGQEAPFIAPLNPTSYATLGEPALSWAGNLWVWTPQIRIEHRFKTGESSQFRLQGGVLDPLTEESPDQFNREPSAGELSRHPAIAGRIAWERSGDRGPTGFGFGAYFGRQNYGFDRTINSWAITGDWQVPITPWAELSGELYRGKAIGGLGGGVWTSAIWSGTPGAVTSQVIGLNDVGGWAQLKLKANPKLEFNLAGGTSNPFARDLEVFAVPVTAYGFSPLARNQAAFGNAIFRPRSNLLFAIEYRHLRTYSFQGKNREGDHLNLAVGVSF